MTDAHQQFRDLFSPRSKEDAAPPDIGAGVAGALRLKTEQKEEAPAPQEDVMKQAVFRTREAFGKFGQNLKDGLVLKVGDRPPVIADAITTNDIPDEMLQKDTIGLAERFGASFGSDKNDELSYLKEKYPDQAYKIVSIVDPGDESTVQSFAVVNRLTGEGVLTDKPTRVSMEKGSGPSPMGFGAKFADPLGRDKEQRTPPFSVKVENPDTAGDVADIGGDITQGVATAATSMLIGPLVRPFGMFVLDRVMDFGASVGRQKIAGEEVDSGQALLEMGLGAVADFGVKSGTMAAKGAARSADDAVRSVTGLPESAPEFSGQLTGGQESIGHTISRQRIPRKTDEGLSFPTARQEAARIGELEKKHDIQLSMAGRTGSRTAHAQEKALRNSFGGSAIFQEADAIRIDQMESAIDRFAGAADGAGAGSKVARAHENWTNELYDVMNMNSQPHFTKATQLVGDRKVVSIIPILKEIDDIVAPLKAPGKPKGAEAMVENLTAYADNLQKNHADGLTIQELQNTLRVFGKGGPGNVFDIADRSVANRAKAAALRGAHKALKETATRAGLPGEAARSLMKARDVYAYGMGRVRIANRKVFESVAKMNADDTIELLPQKILAKGYPLKDVENIAGLLRESGRTSALESLRVAVIEEALEGAELAASSAQARLGARLSPQKVSTVFKNKRFREKVAALSNNPEATKKTLSELQELARRIDHGIQGSDTAFNQAASATRKRITQAFTHPVQALEDILDEHNAAEMALLFNTKEGIDLMLGITRGRFRKGRAAARAVARAGLIIAKNKETARAGLEEFEAMQEVPSPGDFDPDESVPEMLRRPQGQ